VDPKLVCDSGWKDLERLITRLDESLDHPRRKISAEEKCQVVMRMQEDIATQITASHSSAKFPIDPNFKIKTRQLWQEILHSVGWKDVPSFC